MDAPSYPLYVGDVATFNESHRGRHQMAGQAAGRQQQLEEVTMDARPDARGNTVAGTTAAGPVLRPLRAHRAERDDPELDADEHLRRRLTLQVRRF